MRSETELLEHFGGHTSSHRGWIYTGMMLAIVAATAIGAWVYVVIEARLDLRHSDLPIGNAEQIITDAETTFQAAVETDGAPVNPDAGCFFAGVDNIGQTPTVVCGPGWLGVSPPDRPWLEVRVDYRVEAEEALGTVIGISRSVATDESWTFRHPGGMSPADAGEPRYSTTGPRVRGGALLVNAGDIPSVALVAFIDAVEQRSELVVADDPACYLAEQPAQSDATPGWAVTATEAYCGPIRSLGSDPSQIWSRASLRVVDGPAYGSVEVAGVGGVDVRPQALGRGLVLIGADAVEPPGLDDLARPPLAVDYVAALDTQVEVDASGSGELAADFGSLAFEGFARVEQVGEGADALIAAEGHELVIALIAPTERSVSPRGILRVDGVDRPLPGRIGSPEGATLVVSVPASTRTAEMLVENDGRPQTMSLLTGEKGAGYPVALYRESPVELEEPVTLRIEMPVGEAVIVSTTVETLRWGARAADGTWLDEGRASLAVDFEKVSVDAPRTDGLQIESVTTRALLGTPSAPPNPEEAAAPPPGDESATGGVPPEIGDSAEDGGEGDGPASGEQASPDEDATEVTDESPADDGGASSDDDFGVTETDTAQESEGAGTTIDLSISTDLREDPTAGIDRVSPFFEVPETMANAVLAVVVDVTVIIDGDQQVVTAWQMIAIDLPGER